MESGYKNLFYKSLNETACLGLISNNQIKLSDQFYVNYINVLKKLHGYFYSEQKKGLKDLSNNCVKYNYQAHLFLKREFNINSIVTIGHVFLEKEKVLHKYFFEEKAIMLNRIKSKKSNKFGGHVWLTLDGFYVVDVTLFPSIWYERFVVNESKDILVKEEREESFYERILFASLEMLQNFPYKYFPVILGENYLRFVSK